MGVNAEINVVSLIDVMMLLMIVFMIAAPMMQGGVDVQLPKANVQPLSAESGLVVSIDEEGRIFVDRAEVSLSEFGGSIAALAAQKGRDGVYVRADKDGRIEVLVQVLAMIGAAGITNIGIVGEPEDVRR